MRQVRECGRDAGARSLECVAAAPDRGGQGEAELRLSGRRIETEPGVPHDGSGFLLHDGPGRETVLLLRPAVVLEQDGRPFPVEDADADVPHHLFVAVHVRHRVDVASFELPEQESFCLDRKRDGHAISS